MLTVDASYVVRVGPDLVAIAAFPISCHGHDGEEASRVAASEKALSEEWVVFLLITELELLGVCWAHGSLTTTLGVKSVWQRISAQVLGHLDGLN
jgi:hypothetical protein